MGAVVVVGHGPSAEGRGLGSEIDRHVVVRMWNNHWQSRTDYGSRYDYGLFCPPLPDHKTKPAKGWWVYDVMNPGTANGFYPCPIGGLTITRLPFEPWTARAVAMGGEAEGRRFKLTRGCAAACAAIELLQPERLVLVGLDMLRAGATVSPRYGSAAQLDFDQTMVGRDHVFKPAGERREGAHDLEVEGKLVADMAAERKIEIVWLP